MRVGKLIKDMNIKTEEIEAEEVVITLSGGKRLVFSKPKVVKVEAMGNIVYQVIGNPEEVDEEAVRVVMEKTGVSRDEAIRVLKETGGDIAEAIIRLSQ